MLADQLGILGVYIMLGILLIAAGAFGLARVPRAEMTAPIAAPRGDRS